MSQSEANETIMQIGAMIVNDANYANHDWQALALVGEFSRGERSITGYQYFSDGSFIAETPKNAADVIDLLEELYDAMKSERGNEWQQCLIHITKPEMKIYIQFEYNDPGSWSLKNINALDMSDYAERLKPPM